MLNIIIINLDKMDKIFDTRNEMFSSFNKNLVVAELGVFKGEFSKDIKKIIEPKRLFLVDLFSGYFGSGDKDGLNHTYAQLEEEEQKLREFFKNDTNVEIIKNDTISFLDSLDNETLDIVYIDADHSYESVKKDLRHSLSKVKTGGLICGHDYVEYTQAKNAVDDFCRENNLVIKYLTKDGCPSFAITKQ